MITRLSGMAQEAQLGSTAAKLPWKQAKTEYYKAFPDHNNPLILLE
jgi:hypothetical protein